MDYKFLISKKMYIPIPLHIKNKLYGDKDTRKHVLENIWVLESNVRSQLILGMLRITLEQLLPGLSAHGNALYPCLILPFPCLLLLGQVRMFSQAWRLILCHSTKPQWFLLMFLNFSAFHNIHSFVIVSYWLLLWL